MLTSFLQNLHDLLKTVWPFLLLFLWPITVLAVVFLMAAVFKPESVLLGRSKSYALRIVSWVSACLLLIGGFILLSGYEGIVAQYQNSLAGREYVNQTSGAGGSISQEPPYFAILQKVVVEPVVHIDRALQGEDSERLIREVRDAVTRRLLTSASPDVTIQKSADGGVTVKGKAELLIESRVALESSVTKVKLTPLEDFQQENAYRFDFNGSYEWKNSTDKPVTGRFWLTLPSGDVTYRNLKATIRGRTLESPDDDGTLRWEQEMQPGETVHADVSWNADTQGTFTMVPGRSLRKTKHWQLEIEAPPSLKYSRDSLQPTELKGNTRIWNLDDVVTSQPIAVELPAAMMRQEAQTQSYALMPFALLLFGIAYLIAESSRFSVSKFGTLVVAMLLACALPMTIPAFNHPGLLLLVGYLGVTFLAWKLSGRVASLLVVCSMLFLFSAYAGDYTLIVILLTLAATLTLLSQNRSHIANSTVHS